MTTPVDAVRVTRTHPAEPVAKPTAVVELTVVIAVPLVDIDQRSVPVDVRMNRHDTVDALPDFVSRDWFRPDAHEVGAHRTRMSKFVPPLNNDVDAVET